MLNIVETAISKIHILYETALAIVSGKVIIIRDRGDRCDTFVGNSINSNRLRRILVSHLSKEVA